MYAFYVVTEWLYEDLYYSIMECIEACNKDCNQWLCRYGGCNDNENEE
jgi:hypothetical protein